MKPNVLQQYKDSKLVEKEEIQSKVALLKVRSNIHSGDVFPCSDAWCQANCDYYSGGICTCFDGGGHSCDHYIIK